MLEGQVTSAYERKWKNWFFVHGMIKILTTVCVLKDKVWSEKQNEKFCFGNLIKFWQLVMDQLIWFCYDIVLIHELDVTSTYMIFDVNLKKSP